MKTNNLKIVKIENGTWQIIFMPYEWYVGSFNTEHEAIMFLANLVGHL